MKQNHQKRFLLFSPFIFILFSCTSTVPDIFPTYTGAETQQYYIRQEVIKKNPIESMFDFTIILENGQINQDVTANYSIAVKDFPSSQIENINITFLSGDKEFPLTFVSVIYKDPQKQLVRIGATLAPAQFTQLIQSSETISVRFTHPQLETITIASKGLSKNFLKLDFSYSNIF